MCEWSSGRIPRRTWNSLWTYVASLLPLLCFALVVVFKNKRGIFHTRYVGCARDEWLGFEEHRRDDDNHMQTVGRHYGLMVHRLLSYQPHSPMPAMCCVHGHISRRPLSRKISGAKIFHFLVRFVHLEFLPQPALLSVTTHTSLCPCVASIGRQMFSTYIGGHKPVLDNIISISLSVLSNNMIDITVYLSEDKLVLSWKEFVVN